jgi:phosphoadenosine phosphosulfate reductase
MDLNELRNLIEEKSIEESMAILANRFPEKVIFTTSFGMEDQVISQMIFANKLNIKIATLDTGRLFYETYETFYQTTLMFGKTIHVYFPDHKSVEKLVTEKGAYSFFDSLENRKECCRIRKVAPLKRALKGMEVWISGIRADQSDDRNQMQQLEYDETRKIYKYYPLFNWTYQEVRQYAKEKYVPYNPLHDRGFVSIGCQPCTRAIQQGEDFRAGRWWWENEGCKECGVHEEY